MTYLVSIDVLIKLLMFPPVLVQLVLNVLDVLSDVVMRLVRGLLELGELLLQSLMNLRRNIFK